MSGGIAWRIGLRFHNAAAEAARGEIADDNFSDEEACQLMVLAGSSVRRRRRTTNFSGEAFGAARVKDIASESVGQQLLQVFGRNEILIFSVFANETGDVRQSDTTRR